VLLTNQVGECGHTKETKRKGTKKRPWYWNESHQQAFDEIKMVMARDVMLAYPDFPRQFELHTDASTRQLGGVIVQNNRPIAYFSRKLSSAREKYTVTELELQSIVRECLKEHSPDAFSRTSAQEKYSVTELELRSIVECLKEFKRMLVNESVNVNVYL